ncbi:MAG: GspH/FimT family pseudopilin [Shewanella sp.]
MNPLRLQRGLSLIEVLISFAISGILLGAAVPSFQDWVRSTQTRNQTESIQAGLNKARTEALHRNTRVTFWLVSNPEVKSLGNNCVTSDKGDAWVVSLNDPSNKCAALPSDSSDPLLIAKHAAGDGSTNTTVNALPADAVAVTFNGLGQVSTTASGGDAITQIDISHKQVQDNDRSYRLTISAGGQVKMCDPQVTSLSDSRKC